MRALDVATKFENLRANVGFLLPPQLKNSSNNENTVKSTAFWLSVWKKWCLEKGIAKEIENYDPTHLDTFLEQFYAEIKPDMVKPRKRRFHFIESDSDIN